jgi:hypothetical protein
MKEQDAEVAFDAQFLFPVLLPFFWLNPKFSIVKAL